MTTDAGRADRMRITGVSDSSWSTLGLSHERVKELLLPLRQPLFSGGTSAERLLHGGGAAMGAAEIDDRDDVAARAIWSAITEPGDGSAGELISVNGASAALNALADALASTRSRSAVRGVPVSRHQPLDPAALGRWKTRVHRDGSDQTFASLITHMLLVAGREGVTLLTPSDALWPRGLADLGIHAPVCLWVRGDPTHLGRLDYGAAIVGARAATGYGEHVAAEISAGICRRGGIVVSGAAYGIDGAAHRAALSTDGLTMAALAGGVDRFYPAGHDALLRRIAERGVIVSEVPCGTAPTKWRFLQRNRLIAAVTGVTLVVEAGERSGSLNTANHAMTLGRPLGAVPGPVTSPNSAGCHLLLQQFHASCITSAHDLWRAAGFAETGPPPEESADDPRDHRSDPRDDRSTSSTWSSYTHEELRVRDALGRRPRRSSVIAAAAGLSAGEVEGVLALLELRGHAAERSDGWVRTT